MKTFIRNLFVPWVLVAALSLIFAGRAGAQTFTNVHHFTGVGEGAYPHAGLILSGNILYGTTQNGGNSDYGTVFAVHTDGTGFTNLHYFAGAEGVHPAGGVILAGNVLYGTAQDGGSNGNGSVFALNPDGTGFTNLHHFGAFSGDGAYPNAGLILSGDTLYGVAFNGGAAGAGTIFAVSTNGLGYTNLHSFLAFSGDGGFPYADMILSGNTLFGTCKGGVNSSAKGTLFKINTDGSGFTNFYTFTGLNDGATPFGGVILSGSTLYGAAYDGGSAHFGTVFAVDTNGIGFTNLHTFVGGGGNGGINPYSGLVLAGSNLYGTASGGGGFSKGTVFKVSTNGTGFAILHSFTDAPFPGFTNYDGTTPEAVLLSSGNTLYGTAYQGGGFGRGAIFSLSLASVIAPPPLTIIPFGTSVVLMWPTNFTGFTLQAATNLVVPAPGWSTVLPAPIIVNGQYTVTNLVLGPMNFYRLIQ